MSNKAPTYAEFIIQYPAFEGLSKLVVDAQLACSARLLDEGAWGEFFSDGVGLDAAHNLVLSQSANKGVASGLQGAAGPVTSTSAAGMNISFAQFMVNDKSKADQWYSKTIFGQQFLRLRNTVIAPGALSA